MVWTCDEEWVKKCMKFKVEGRRPNTTWLEKQIWQNLRSIEKMSMTERN